MIIGFTGNKGAGKDTAGQFLVDTCGFTRIAFADPLKEAVANLFGVTIPEVDLWKSGEVTVELTRRDKAPQVEFLSKMKILTWREFLQRFGTEMGRNTFWQDFWVELWEDRVDVLGKDVSIVATDVRFENEAYAVHKLGGIVVEITRPECEPDGHASEALLPRHTLDAQITNSGTLEDLQVDVFDLYKELQRA